jgi:putative transposase
MAREAPIIQLTADERDQLRRLANAASTPQALAFRARIILRCESPTLPHVPRNDHVAAELDCDPATVSKWRRRFQRQRLGGLDDLPRSGRPAAFSPGGPPQGARAGHHPAG